MDFLFFFTIFKTVSLGVFVIVVSVHIVALKCTINIVSVRISSLELILFNAKYKFVSTLRPDV